LQQTDSNFNYSYSILIRPNSSINYSYSAEYYTPTIRYSPIFWFCVIDKAGCPSAFWPTLYIYVSYCKQLLMKLAHHSYYVDIVQVRQKVIWGWLRR